ncbi:MAG: hypothetical protein Q8K81_00925 [Sulfuricurvum sp.]|nr:hypothetical protein [Sulfuricurvum sp.]
MITPLKALDHFYGHEQVLKGIDIGFGEFVAIVNFLLRYFG